MSLLKVIAEQKGKATTFYQDLKAVGSQELQEPQELKRVYDVCSNELQRMGAEMLGKLWAFLDNPFGEDLKSLKIEVNSLNPEILKEEKWDDLFQLFERVCVKDGPMLKHQQAGETLRRYIKGY